MNFYASVQPDPDAYRSFHPYHRRRFGPPPYLVKPAPVWPYPYPHIYRFSPFPFSYDRPSGSFHFFNPHPSLFVPDPRSLQKPVPWSTSAHYRRWPIGDW